MKLRTSIPLILAVALSLAGDRVDAQSDILLQLRSGSPAGDRVRVDSAGGFVAMGQLGIGIIPSTGQGERMMWYPFRSAFRAGSVSSTCPNCWDDANVGFFSMAVGWDVMARGLGSVALGSQSRAEAQYSVAMGDRAEAFAPAGGPFATGGVAMGIRTQVHNRAGAAIGELSTSHGITAMALGYRATARADYAAAMGRGAVARHLGSFVWGGISATSQTDSIESSTAGEFSVRAPGGVRLRTNYGLTTGCNLTAGSGVWSCTSTRDMKENFVPVDHEDHLARVARVPVNHWSYIDEPGSPLHLGPFAEDFREAFGLGDDARTIGHLDLSGVNFAGVQALERRTARLQEQLAARDARIAELETRLVTLEAANGRLAEIERRLAEIERGLDSGGKR